MSGAPVMRPDAFVARYALDQSAESLVALLRGVQAAPGFAERDDWAELVLPDADAEAVAALRAMCAALPAPGAAVPRDARVPALRELLTARGLDAWLVPRSGPYLGEYVAGCDARLAWLTGFTGSAGLAIVAREQAVIFVDGRYTLQVREQADPEVFAFASYTYGAARWLRELAESCGAEAERPLVVGYDPRLHSAAWISGVCARLEDAPIVLAPTTENLVDAVWADQPPRPISPVVPHSVQYAGREASEKIDLAMWRLGEDGLDAFVVATPDLVAWLLNVRGGDVPYLPVVHSVAIVRRERVDWFVAPEKLTAAARAALDPRVQVCDEAMLEAALSDLSWSGAVVQVDSRRSNAWIRALLDEAGAVVREADDPLLIPRACKSEAEQEGARAAHRRDAVATARFLAWFDRVAPTGALTEISAQAQLESFRSEVEGWRGLSYSHISAFGPHGAIVHYRATPETDLRIEPGSLYLLDSGAQYPDATLDMTRTISVGTPTEEMRARYTAVLRGHIALARARFPLGATGAALNTLARAPLWQAGIDFDHGTGHGVGSYLSVHEGPHSISAASRVALEPGMLFSNEPGYYKAGEYGVRLENLVLVREAQVDGERAMLEVETVTFIPFDRRLIDASALNREERAWLDAYHAHTLALVRDHLDTEDLAWAEAACAPL